jgi:hypothetical protein
MIDTTGIAGGFAYFAFVALMVFDIWNDFNPKRTGLFVVLWLAGFIGLRFVPNGGLFFAPYVACLDVALAFRLFYGETMLK